MFELKFAAEVSDLAGTWAVGVLALVYDSGITLPALAEYSIGSNNISLAKSCVQGLTSYKECLA